MKGKRFWFSISGAGIVVLGGQAAARSAGPSVIISFLISGIVALLAALSYSELAAMMSHSGAAYTYTYAGKLTKNISVLLIQILFVCCFSIGRYILNWKYQNEELRFFCYYL